MLYIMLTQVLKCDSLLTLSTIILQLFSEVIRTLLMTTVWLTEFLHSSAILRNTLEETTILLLFSCLSNL